MKRIRRTTKVLSCPDNSDYGAIQSLVGVSPWLRQLRAQILDIALYDSTILISGPTGTGKELIARAIHENSGRAENPFIAVNCAAVAGSLFESHMF